MGRIFPKEKPLPQTQSQCVPASENMDTDRELTLTRWWEETQGAAGEEGGGSRQHWKGLRSLYILTSNNINPELLDRSVDVLNTKA